MTADEIRAERARRGWTQEELATAAGVHVATIIRAEGGRNLLPVVHDAIARALDPVLRPDSSSLPDGPGAGSSGAT